MKLVWKGKFKGMDYLPKADLPEDAVQFKEPGSLVMVNIVAVLFIIPVIIMVGIFTFIKRNVIGFVDAETSINYFGVLLAFLMVLPHEFLHAVCFPKDAIVEVYYSFKHMMAFVISTHPTSKARFIFLSALPSLVFGILPLTIWLFIPSEFVTTGTFIYSFGLFNLLFGCGDFMNIFNATIQMPKGAITQLSGFHSYWYMPKN